MGLKSEYIHAIEMKLRWLRFVNSPLGIQHCTREGYGPALPIYRGMLETSDTYYMNPKFSDLVEHARREMPSDIRFDPEWMQSPTGWIWLDDQFEVPRSHAWLGGLNLPPQFVPYVRAVAWRRIPPNQKAYVFPAPRTGVMVTHTGDIPDGSYQFACFDTMTTNVVELGGFGCWSYFVLSPGDVCQQRIEEFEEVSNKAQDPGAYLLNRDREVLHEIRWVYAALHLMSLRLATTVEHPTDRATRRRAEKGGQVAPPNIRVITLRRLEQERPREGAPGSVDWQWQWEVRGHWRNQFYPSENVHKPVFIEAFIKGPEDKPLKPGALKLFAARR